MYISIHISEPSGIPIYRYIYIIPMNTHTCIRIYMYISTGDLCSGFHSARKRLVNVAPRNSKEGGEKGEGKGSAGACHHVMVPECCGYEYSVSAGGDRVTVVAAVRNPFVEAMVAVSLCVSAVGFRSDCRSCQVFEIPPGLFIVCKLDVCVCVYIDIYARIFI